MISAKNYSVNAAFVRLSGRRAYKRFQDNHIYGWTDQDGTPLPSSLPGFTGRLAKVVKADGGSELNEISNFEIKLGRKMQVLRFSEDQDNTHFYVHVSGQPTDRNPDFSGSAADSGPLASRPANYVPIRVPMYDKASSPNDPREPAVYRYIFRPEYTFSLYRSVLPIKPPKPADPGKPEITETSPEDRPASGSDTNQNPENNREALEAVLGAYGLNYLLTTDKANPLPILDSAPGSLVFGNGTDSETTAVIDSNGRIVIGSAQTLSALTPEDYFALKLYSNGDEGNVLWQIETPVISNIELQDEHEKKVLNAPMGTRVYAKAKTHPKNREVLWTVEEHQDGVNAIINRYAGYIYVLDNSKSGPLPRL
ncbi:hypothetical protein [Desulforegula conservatrix]|uniref:hypothetical protein n=1 Tax=Desulforegula conservatrix TaxID=153026 RepID=UPI00040C867C|nr:hypothetical protein [Desulforegula conservatrix]